MHNEAQSKVDRYQSLYPEGEEIARVKMLELELDFQRELEKRQQAARSYVELFNRGRFALSNGAFDDAIKIFDEAAHQRPSDAEASYNQALAYERLGEFATASEQFRRYLELSTNPSDKNDVDQHLFRLENEIKDMQTKFVCSFCGYKLPLGTVWCHRCWHGPYLFDSPQWNSRPCVLGATVTRTMFYVDGRFGGNDEMSCMVKGGLMKDILRYTPDKQRAIQQSRKSEGWTYRDDVLVEKRLNDVVVLTLDQGNDYLMRLLSPGSGDVLSYQAIHRDGEWLLEKEDLIFDGVKFFKSYTYAGSKIVREEVVYQNRRACDHIIGVSADYTWGAARINSITFSGRYNGFRAEGTPSVEWRGTLTFGYDTKGRLEREEFTISSFTKTYTEKPESHTRKLVKDLYPSVKYKKPMNIIRSGDLCGTAGNLRLGNQVDLRPFYTISPSFATQLPFGVAKMTIDYTYPESYTLGDR